MRKRVDALVQSYRTDFDVHDVRSLSSVDPAAPFYWVVGETGTHMFHRDLISAEVRRIAGPRDWPSMRGWAKALRNVGRYFDSCEVWKWDGENFSRVRDLDAAAATVDRWESFALRTVHA